jgi:hypothetical protein
VQFTNANARILHAAPSDPTNLTIGYGVLQSSSASAAPGAVALFSFRRNGVLVSETSVPASQPMTSGRVYAEIGAPVNTGLRGRIILPPCAEF